LLRTTDRDVCGHAIRRKCVCAPGLVFAHDDLPLTCLHITPTIADGRGAVDRGDPKPLFRLALIRNWSQQQPRTEAGPDESGQGPGDPFLNALAGRGLYVSRPGDNTEWNMLRPWVAAGRKAMERTDWIDQGYDSAAARFLMLTAITHHQFDSPVWGQDEVRKLHLELTEIDLLTTQAYVEHAARRRLERAF
jgi:hypothetical protein